MTAHVPVPPSDGGFSSGLPGDRVIRGTIARWSANTGWVDRDGLPMPPIVLVIGLNTVLRRWKDKRAEYITEQPLPDPKQLNNAIPLAEWELGLDGKPRAPWALTYVIYMVDLKTGAPFTYAHDTYGAMLCYNALEERIAVMRMLRGEYVFPIARLEKRPWKSATYGMQMRPHIEPTGDWRSPGGFQSIPQSPPPQIPGPATTAATPAATPAAPPPTAPPPTASPPTTSSQSTVLDNTKPVKPVTVGEFIADEIPWK
jgi:hypothetical protein